MVVLTFWLGVAYAPSDLFGLTEAYPWLERVMEVDREAILIGFSFLLVLYVAWIDARPYFRKFFKPVPSDEAMKLAGLVNSIREHSLDHDYNSRFGPLYDQTEKLKKSDSPIWLDDRLAKLRRGLIGDSQNVQHLKYESSDREELREWQSRLSATSRELIDALTKDGEPPHRLLEDKPT